MTDYLEHHNKAMRLAILQVLDGLPDYTANSAVLTNAVQSLGFYVSRDLVEGELDWLCEQRLVKIEDLKVARVISATQRGIDVAKGLARNSGVERPGPQK